MDGDLFGTLYSTNVHLPVSLYRFAIQLHRLFFGLAVNPPTMPESRPSLCYGHRLCACEGHGSSLDPHRRLWWGYRSKWLRLLYPSYQWCSYQWCSCSWFAASRQETRTPGL